MRSEVFAAFIGAAIVCAAPASAQTATTITYQGHLAQSGTPVTGAYEFEVRLLDTLAIQIGSTQSTIAIVTDGLFNIDLDFGDAAFDGNERYLEISVRSFDQGGAYTTLSPNHLVASTPVAQFALAGNEGPGGPAGPQGETGPQGGTGSPGLDGDDGAPGSPGSPGTDGTNGTNGTNGTDGTDGPQGVQGIQGPQGDQGNPGDSHWTLNGNTTSYTAGEVGIGVANPLHPLHVLSTIPGGLAVYATSSNNGGVGLFGRATHTGSVNSGVWGETLSPFGRGVYGIAYASTGFTSGVHGLAGSPNGSGVYGLATNTSGGNHGVYGETAGTTGTGVYGYANSSTGNNRGVFGISESTTGIGVYGYAFKLTGINYGVWGKTNSDSGYAGYFTGGRNYFEGRVGVGVDAPSDQVHISAPAGTDAFRVQQGGATRLRINDLGGVSLGGNSTVVAAGNTYVVNNLGIGDSTPEAELDVVGNGVISGILTVGTATPQTSFKLGVSGTAAKTGGGSWAVFSDQRLKTNITPMTGSLDTISALRPVNFEYSNTGHFSYLPGVQRGFIAQEVQGVIPQWVNTADDGYFYLDQLGYEALLVDAVQELRAEKDAENKQLREETSSLLAQKDREIEQLRARLDRLEQMMSEPGTR